MLLEMQFSMSHSLHFSGSRSRVWLTAAALYLVFGLVTGRVSADCSLTATSKMPLNELGAAQYLGQAGGLYPDGSNVRPPAHAAAASQMASQVIPLGTNGNDDPLNGRIVLLSIGISNTAQEFLSGGTGSFMSQMQNDTSKNPKVDILNGAFGGHAAIDWANPADSAWTNLQQVLANANRDPLQVQVIWMKLADRINQIPDPTFPASAQWHQANLETVLRMLQVEFPNLKFAFLSSRTRSYGVVGEGSSPEPIAYETGFAVKWLIEKQISGDPSLNYDINQGPVLAPLVVWGPYLWVDGLTPRSDGLIWTCGDLQADFNHPSASGVTKVGDQLVSFFKTDPLTRPWFLRTQVIGQAPVADIVASISAGPAPLEVQFDAVATDTDGTIVQTAWTFGDGGFAVSASPIKTFAVPGAYEVNLTVTDDDGNPVAVSTTITVLGPGGVPSTSQWGCTILVLSLLVAGTVALRADTVTAAIG